jgi:chaperonin GroES
LWQGNPTFGDDSSPIAPQIGTVAPPAALSPSRDLPPYPSHDMSSSDSNRAPRASKLEVVEPIGKRVLIRKDDDKKQTKSGIHLPTRSRFQPSLVGLSPSPPRSTRPRLPRQEVRPHPLQPQARDPVDLEGDNRLFVVPIEDVVAVFRREDESA